MQTPGSAADQGRRVAAALQAASQRIDELEQRAREPIAIIGMGCRVPGGGDDPQSLWSLLAGGVDAVTPIPAQRRGLVAALGDIGFDSPSMRDEHGAFLEGIEQFDPAFFGISQREARRMDPQHRLLLEVAWEALENAALRPADLRGSRTGVYAGICFEDFAHLGLATRSTDELDVALSIGSSRALGVGRVAYTLDLHGPVMQLDTTCSSSLLAVHLAAHALRRGECDLALAGGVNAMLAHEVFLAFQRMGALSRTGRCRAFDARGDGYVRGEGCGIVVLKTLGAAQAAGDHIWAVIEGTAVNHDGRSNGLTAPNGAAQEAVIREALANARVAPADVQYLEAHGTGTPLGDPIEVAAAMRVLGAGRPADRPLYLGSIKSNVGHLEGAAGVAGLMKAALALHHRRIPAHLHFAEPNPRIAWDELPVRVPAATIDWPQARGGDGLHAGVSSFGMSGTNVHAVLGAAPAPAPRTARYDRPEHVLVISARSDASLRGMARRFAEALDRPGGPSLGDACFTANTTRQPFSRRAAFVASDNPAMTAALRGFAAGGMPACCVTGSGHGPAAQASAAGDGRALAAQAAAGAAVDWAGFYQGCGLRRVPLPPCVFDRNRCWLDRVTVAEPDDAAAEPAQVVVIHAAAREDAHAVTAGSARSAMAVAAAGATRATVGASAPGAASSTIAAPARRADPRAPADLTPAGLRAALLAAVAAATDRPADQIDENAPLAELGLDSLAAADVLITMERYIGRALPDQLFMQTASISELAGKIGEEPPAAGRQEGTEARRQEGTKARRHEGTEGAGDESRRGEGDSES